MKRLSPHLGSDSLEIRNTGLRPNWSSFWALETAGSDLERSPRRPADSVVSCKSAMSGGSATSGSGVRHVRLVTGSEWVGEWDRTGMSGMGMYKMPHDMVPAAAPVPEPRPGPSSAPDPRPELPCVPAQLPASLIPPGVIYEGTMKAGLFEGVGVLRYPNGSILEGLWYQGKLKYWQYDYADGLERDCQAWTYCSMPDRRFFSEHTIGYRPANAEQVTNDHPAREIPSGHYDAGLGFYNPKTHCVVDVITGDVLSIPTAAEEKWIVERCRSAEPTESVGYCPHLYENWQKKYQSQTNSSEVKPEEFDEECKSEGMLTTSDSCNSKGVQHQHSLGETEKHQDIPKLSGNSEAESENAFVYAEKEILRILHQEGGKLQPVDTPNTTLRKCSLHEKLENEQGQEQFRAASFEELLKKLLKEMEFQQTVKTSLDSGVKPETLSNESNLFTLTQIITAFAENSNNKNTASCSLGDALEQFRMTGKFLPSFSLPMSKPFSNSCSSLNLSNGSGSDNVNLSTDSMTLEKNKSEESIINYTTYEISEG